MDALQQHDLTAETPKYPEFNLTAATGYMRKLRALDANDAEIDTAADNQVFEINDWRDTEKAKNNDERGYLKGLLGAYLDQLRKEDPKARIVTPYGTVSTRKQAAGVEWSDKDLLESLEDQNLSDLIRIKKEPDKKAIKKTFSFVSGHYINADGQELKGAVEKPAYVNLVVKTDVPTP